MRYGPAVLGHPGLALVSWPLPGSDASRGERPTDALVGNITMDDVSVRKLKAAAKIAFGVYEIGSSTAMAVGHGFAGTFLKKHHLMTLAVGLAKRGVKAGQHSFESGVRDWKNADKC